MSGAEERLMPHFKFAPGSGDGNRRLADRVGDLVARLEMIRAQDRLDAERWADDGGRVNAMALATPVRQGGDLSQDARKRGH
jgi:hypothetical protein